MPKYKYVDGVKYRVVPQSVLGYALVREGSDNSLPTGGTEGQVLTKASNTDYDVEWSTVESGGGEDLHFIMDIAPGNYPGAIVLADETKTEEYFNNLKNGKIPILSLEIENPESIDTYITSNCIQISKSTTDSEETYTALLKEHTVSNSGVLQKNYEVIVSNILSTGLYQCEINVTTNVYPGGLG